MSSEIHCNPPTICLAVNREYLPGTAPLVPPNQGRNIQRLYFEVFEISCGRSGGVKEGYNTGRRGLATI